MFTALKITAGIVLVAMVFLVSGWIANIALAYTGCIWTSSGVFGLSSIGLLLVIGSALANGLNLFHFF